VSLTVTDAVLARLTAILPGDVTVYDGQVPGVPTARYVCVYGDPGQRTPDAIDGVSRMQTHSVQVTSVAVNLLQCEWVATQVRDGLTDWIPAVDNTAPGMFRHSLSRRPAPDESVADRHLMFAVDQFSIYLNRTN
jgi:hypothetical protein